MPRAWDKNCLPNRRRGPIDVMFTPGFVSNVDHWWEMSTPARFIDSLNGFTTGGGGIKRGGIVTRRSIWDF